MDFLNSYQDVLRAKAYAKLEFPGTYYLAYRDLPEIIKKHINGQRALDFGCGTGRSTRFLQKIGFNTIGVDIAKSMIKQAKETDPSGNYYLIEEGVLDQFRDNTYDLVLSAFTFDNIPTREKKVRNFLEIRRILKMDGIFVNLVSSPEIYTHEWVSFSTKDFPENKNAKNGDVVRIIITAIADKRPVEDVLWMDEDYQDVFEKSGLKLITTYKPLAKETEQYDWINEIKIAPWVIYLLRKTINK